MFTKSVTLLIGLAATTTLAQVTTTTTVQDLPAATVGCSNTPLTNSDDVSIAVYDLQSNCDAGTIIPAAGSDGVAGRISYPYNSGNAYACSSGGDNPCSGSEMAAVVDTLGAVCGSYAGYFYIQDWEKTYGWGNAGDGFC